MNGGKTNKTGTRFGELVAAIEADGPLDATVLATNKPRATPSREATQAAEQLVGAVGKEQARIGRLARLLDELRAADQATGAPKRRAS